MDSRVCGISLGLGILYHFTNALFVCFVLVFFKYIYLICTLAELARGHAENVTLLMRMMRLGW